MRNGFKDIGKSNVKKCPVCGRQINPSQARCRRCTIGAIRRKAI